MIVSINLDVSYRRVPLEAPTPTPRGQYAHLSVHQKKHPVTSPAGCKSPYSSPCSEFVLLSCFEA